MKLHAYRNLGNYPAGKNLSADDITEFHAARLLLILDLCQYKGEVKGLTKLAKLDFYVRYPNFFERLLQSPKNQISVSKDYPVESHMIRYHYGPWDPRYYQVLPYLEGTGLIKIEKGSDGAYLFVLTELGREKSSLLQSIKSFEQLVNHIKNVGKALKRKSGDTLKKEIYNLFKDEVTDRKRGEVIQ